MTQEDKELLLKDLCARLPYGVKCQHFDDKTPYALLGIDEDVLHIDCPVYDEGDGYVEIEYFKPYLRPMSSMTKEEKHKLLKFGAVNLDKDNNVIDVCCVGFLNHTKVQDYLNSIHIDYRGLIERGLALEAPGGMYNIKEE